MKSICFIDVNQRLCANTQRFYAFFILFRGGSQRNEVRRLKGKPIKGVIENTNYF